MDSARLSTYGVTASALDRSLHRQTPQALPSSNGNVLHVDRRRLARRRQFLPHADRGGRSNRRRLRHLPPRSFSHSQDGVRRPLRHCAVGISSRRKYRISVWSPHGFCAHRATWAGRRRLAGDPGFSRDMGVMGRNAVAVTPCAKSGCQSIKRDGDQTQPRRSHAGTDGNCCADVQPNSSTSQHSTTILRFTLSNASA